jgi:Zn-dependent protease
MNQLNLIQTLAVSILPLIFTFVFYELARGWMAVRLGDRTPIESGRMHLNLWAHIDLVGTLLLPCLTIVLSHEAGFPLLFGWARPMPINYARLRQPRRDQAWVAAAGPLACLLMAILWTLLTHIGGVLGSLGEALGYMCLMGIVLNLSFFAFNLLPLPPLAMGRILLGVLPLAQAQQLARIEPYCFWILLALMLLKVLQLIILPIIWFLLQLLSPLAAAGF